VIALAAALAVFYPQAQPFNMNGGMTVMAPGFSNQNCQFHMTGSTINGEIVIQSATFCPGVVATGLPWSWEAGSVTNSTGHGVISVSVQGHNCGARSHKIFDFLGGFLIYPQNVNECTIGGGASQTSPNIMIGKWPQDPLRH
jgi:hypothetical protein